MAWFGGTHGRPTRREKREDFAFVLDAGKLRREFPQVRAPLTSIFWVRWRWGVPHLEHNQVVDEPSRPEKGVSILKVTLVQWPIYGVRWFLHCPGCGDRCDKLFAKQTHAPFQCRLCAGFAYLSTQKWNNQKRKNRHDDKRHWSSPFDVGFRDSRGARPVP